VHGNDFEMIEHGGGNADMEMGLFTLASSYNLLLTEPTREGIEWQQPRQNETGCPPRFRTESGPGVTDAGAAGRRVSP
jgi:hypothetical protein